MLHASNHITLRRKLMFSANMHVQASTLQQEDGWMDGGRNAGGLCVCIFFIVAVMTVHFFLLLFFFSCKLSKPVCHLSQLMEKPQI